MMKYIELQDGQFIAEHVICFIGVENGNIFVDHLACGKLSRGIAKSSEPSTIDSVIVALRRRIAENQE